jgi:hypothetical protein
VADNIPSYGYTSTSTGQSVLSLPVLYYPASPSTNFSNVQLNKNARNNLVSSSSAYIGIENDPLNGINSVRFKDSSRGLIANLTNVAFGKYVVNDSIIDNSKYSAVASTSPTLLGKQPKNAYNPETSLSFLDADKEAIDFSPTETVFRD